jgi:probable selenium-dependent hydroxylase accessory protein YqeC
MNFITALGISEHRVISLVGSGGKTTIMFALARELVSLGKRVVTTTTTMILIPTNQQSPHLVLGTEEATIIDEVQNKMNLYQHVTVAGRKLDDFKLKGIEPEVVDKLADSKNISHIIVEADGSAGRPLKAPNENEPVIPSSTSLVIAVGGIDGLGEVFDEDVVFRSQIASALLDESLGQIITVGLAARLLAHPQGIIKGTPEKAQIVYFINKLGPESSLPQASELAHLILETGNPQVKRVVLGQAQSDDPVLEVIQA